MASEEGSQLGQALVNQLREQVELVPMQADIIQLQAQQKHENHLSVSI